MTTSDWVQVALIIVVGVLLAVLIKVILALKAALDHSIFGRL